MDAQRIVLIGALAVVTYLLVLAWNEDYGQAAKSKVPATPVTTSNGANTTQQPLAQQPLAPDSIPSPVVGEQNSADADLPTIQVEQDPSVVSDAAKDTVLTAQNSGLITVRTNVLNVQIDPRGGDIVSAALLQYPLLIDEPDNPLMLLSRNAERVYVAQSGLIGANGPDAAKDGRPLYQSASTNYELNPNQESINVDLVLQDDNGVVITKRFIFSHDKYLIDIEYLIDNRSSQAWQAIFFAQLKRDNSEDPSQSTSIGMASYLGAATTTQEERYKKVGFDDVEDGQYKHSQKGGWIAILQHYFVSAWIPNDSGTYTYQVRKNSNGDNIAGLVGQNVIVNPGESQTISAQLYAGPKIQERLEQISPALELTVDYGWLWFIAQPLFWLLSLFHDLVGNWGWAIILTTLVVKLLFFQLSATSYKSMANMRRVAPKLASMKEQYGDDRQKMSAAMMELYKKEKINPLGGCLPILVQMPVFIALYWTLMESVELRHSPFIFWLNDLSVMDPYFVLPILMGVTMFIQQQLNPAPADPMQAKVMKMMPIIFTFFFLWFPSGLVLYWVANNVLSIAQQWVITRRIENAAAGKT